MLFQSSTDGGKTTKLFRKTLFRTLKRVKEARKKIIKH